MATKRIKKRASETQQARGGRYWLAVGTLATYSAAGGGRLTLAQKNESKDGQASPRIQGLPVRRFTIPSGVLEDVTRKFSAVTGTKVSASTQDLFSISSPGVNGTFTIAQALEKMLAGTGLRYRLMTDGSVLLELKPVYSSASVTASAPVLPGSLPKYQTPLADTPQTVSVVPQQTLEQQGTTTLRDALRNVAGISLAAGEGGSQGDNLTVRGFTARNDLFIDGMRDFGSYYRDPFNTQEVEVLQGPSSVTFGRGSTGGVVNQATKAPELNRFIAAGLQFGTDATRRATLDIDVPIPSLGSGAALRLNAMGDIDGVAGRDVTENRRDGFAPSLALGLGTPTRLTFSYFHQNADDIPDYGIPWLFNGPAPVDRSNYYGLQDGNFLRTYDDIGTAKIEHDVNSSVTVRDQLRYANYVRDVLITEPQLNGITLARPLDAMQVTRHEIGVNSTETYLDDQLDVIAHFKTGVIKHTLVSGVEGGRETSDPTRPAFTAPPTSLLNPDPSQNLNASATIASRVTDTALSAGAYALDTVNLGSKWILTGGVRFRPL